eukprot:3477531-Rhodomonas_salina.1
MCHGHGGELRGAPAVGKEKRVVREHRGRREGKKKGEDGEEREGGEEVSLGGGRKEGRMPTRWGGSG